jgi:hypothetical protein
MKNIVTVESLVFVSLIECERLFYDVGGGTYQPGGKHRNELVIVRFIIIAGKLSKNV